MENSLTITLAPGIKAALEAFLQAEGMPLDDLASKAIEDYLFIHTFRTLRSRVMQKTSATYTDEDIFEMVS